MWNQAGKEWWENGLFCIEWCGKASLVRWHLNKNLKWEANVCNNVSELNKFHIEWLVSLKDSVLWVHSRHNIYGAHEIFWCRQTTLRMLFGRVEERAVVRLPAVYSYAEHKDNAWHSCDIAAFHYCFRFYMHSHGTLCEMLNTHFLIGMAIEASLRRLYRTSTAFQSLMMDSCFPNILSLQCNDLMTCLSSPLSPTPNITKTITSLRVESTPTDV